MTLQELKERSEEQGFIYAYGQFKEVVQPPHLVAKINESNNFVADSHVYEKINQIQLDYTYITKDVKEMNKIEDNILFDVVWRKTDETYLSDEDVWQVSYFFEI